MYWPGWYCSSSLPSAAARMRELCRGDSFTLSTSLNFLQPDQPPGAASCPALALDGQRASPSAAPARAPRRRRPRGRAGGRPAGGQAEEDVGVAAEGEQRREHDEQQQLGVRDDRAEGGVETGGRRGNGEHDGRDAEDARPEKGEGGKQAGRGKRPWLALMVSDS